MAAIALLLLAAGAAQLLIWHREKTKLIELGSSVHYPEGQLSVSLPLGWQTLDKALCPAGTVIAVEDRETEGRQRRLYVFRGPPSSEGLAASASLRALDSFSNALGADVLFEKEPETAQVGAFPGVTATMAKRLGAVGVKPPFCLGRAAVGPGGEVVGVLLETALPSRRTDQLLVQRVAETVELTSIGLDPDPAEAMAAAGISFDIPRGARFIGPIERGLPRVRLMSRQTAPAWYLDLFRVPLIARRKVNDLVEDGAMSLLQQVRLGEPLEPFDPGGRQAARASLVITPGKEPTVHLVAVKTDQHTALLMVGRHDAEAGTAVRELCDSIAATARVESYDELVDLESAIDAARRLIKDCRKEGMSSLLGRREGRRLRFNVEAPALGLGSWIETCRRSSDNAELPWEVTGRWVYDPRWRGHARIVVTEGWRLAENGVEYLYRFERSDAGEKSIEQTEHSDAEGRQVTRIVKAFGGSRTEEIEVDDAFASGPLLTELCARTAGSSSQRSVVVSTIDTFTAGVAYCVIKPLGRTPVPGTPMREPARTVRLMMDYDPEPMLMYFDDGDELLAVSHDARQWRKRVQPPSEAEEQPGVGPGLRR
ncbi:MAG TPA: hypothetical protein PLL20_09465 [Phycisphaerae bacterium]|nr:hypothetical protein [Phycisphaerae bacterium]HRR85311.1 hypothetical protein [Phycisphaerae bacterium]